MSKMTIFQLGVIVFVACLSTQVVSQSTTNTTVGSSTSNPNSSTTMATGTYSSSTNSTTPAGAGILLHADIFSFLVPIIMAALLQCYC